jgi:hypothetical protein
VVLRLPGESQGADGEVALARERGLPVAFGWEQLEAALKQSEAVGATGSAHVITGQRLTCLISNAHRLLKRRYRSSPLWAMMSDLTGNGSTIAAEICRAAGYDPSQPCGAKYLKAKGE